MFTYYYNVKKLNGRSERTRTFDPLVPNQVRYQTALHSVTLKPKSKRNAIIVKRLLFVNSNLYFYKKITFTSQIRSTLTVNEYNQLSITTKAYL